MEILYWGLAGLSSFVLLLNEFNVDSKIWRIFFRCLQTTQRQNTCHLPVFYVTKKLRLVLKVLLGYHCAPPIYREMGGLAFLRGLAPLQLSGRGRLHVLCFIRFYTLSLCFCGERQTKEDRRQTQDTGIAETCREFLFIRNVNTYIYL